MCIASPHQHQHQAVMAPLIVDFPQEPRNCNGGVNASKWKHLQSSKAFTPSRSRRRVSFTDRAQVKHIENLSSEHKPDLWYSDQDIQSMKANAVQKILKIKSVMTMAEYAELHSKNTSKFMGFEKYLTEEGMQKILERRQRIRREVMIEHERQSRLNVYDPDTMANISEVVSSFSRRRARIVGLLHYEEEECVTRRKQQSK